MTATSREFQIEAPKTYATRENARKAVAKNPGDLMIRHTYLRGEDDRWFPVFFPTEQQMSDTGIHFRWSVIR